VPALPRGIGIGGSLLGGGAAVALGANSGDTGTLFFASLAAAALILFLYRRFVQKRPLTGPRAQRAPLRPRGLGQIVRREPHQFLEETATPGQRPLEQLEKLVALRDAGKIDRDESERRKAALVEQL